MAAAHDMLPAHTAAQLAASVVTPSRMVLRIRPACVASSKNAGRYCNDGVGAVKIREH